MATDMGPRAENRAAMEANVRRLGREHLRTHGAAGLSLRAIARDLGVVSSAVYRYVAGRDDLLTLLVVEAYTDLADAAEAAMPRGATPRARLLAAAEAVRAWAVADPARWALLYGSPVPGYRAPAEATTEPGTRVVRALLREFAAAEVAGGIRADLPTVPASLTADTATIRATVGLTMSDAAVLAATHLWATLVGGVSLEVFGQYGDGVLADPRALFVRTVEATLDAALA